MKRLLRVVFREYRRKGVVTPKVSVYTTRNHFTSSTVWRCTLTERTADSFCEQINDGYDDGHAPGR